MHNASKIRHGKTVMSYVKKIFQLCIGAAQKALGSTRYTELLINENRAHVATVIFKAGVTLTLPTIIKEERAAKLPPWRR